jgi:hypothetical protein
MDSPNFSVAISMRRQKTRAATTFQLARGCAMPILMEVKEKGFTTARRNVGLHTNRKEKTISDLFSTATEQPQADTRQ